jgi:hypothetical protein
MANLGKRARGERAGASPRAEDEALAPAGLNLVDDLPAELLVRLDDELAAALSCRRLHAAVASARLRDGRASSTTSAASVLATVRRVEWALSCSLPLDVELAVLAARRGQLDALRGLRARGCPWNEETCLGAAAGGHLAVLQWARANGCPWDLATCSYAAFGGHLEVLQWARASGCPWDRTAIWAAAAAGHIHVLQWASANGLELTESTGGRGSLNSAAARGGHLDALQWLRANSCPWDELTSARAAIGGHLPVLAWAVANGCPWGKLMCRAAVRGAQLELLQWARANGCPWGEFTCRHARELLGEEGLDVEDELFWLEYGERGGNFNDPRKGLTAERVEAIMEWLRANGCPGD